MYKKPKSITGNKRWNQQAQSNFGDVTQKYIIISTFTFANDETTKCIKI